MAFNRRRPSLESAQQVRADVLTIARIRLALRSDPVRSLVVLRVHRLGGEQP